MTLQWSLGGFIALSFMLGFLSYPLVKQWVEKYIKKQDRRRKKMKRKNKQTKGNIK